MIITQIGSITFDNTTNIIVEPTTIEVPGGGFRVNEVHGPQPFSVEIAFVRQSRFVALGAVNTLARDLYVRSRRRTLPNVAGGVVVWARDRSDVLVVARLYNASMNLISVETTGSGVLARVRVFGTLDGPFRGRIQLSQSITNIRPYNLQTVSLNGVGNEELIVAGLVANFTNNVGLRDVLVAVESREENTAVSRIYRKRPSSVSDNLALESFNVGGFLTLERARFTSGGNGEIIYNINPSELETDIFHLFFEIYLPSESTSDVLYRIRWDGQQEIAGVVDYKRTFIKAGIYTKINRATVVTLIVEGAPENTYISPLIFFPVDGVVMFHAVADQLERFSAYDPTLSPEPALLAEGSTIGEVRGPAGFVAGRFLTLFVGMMTPAISNLTANVTFRYAPVDPSTFM